MYINDNLPLTRPVDPTIFVPFSSLSLSTLSSAWKHTIQKSVMVKKV